MTLETAAPYVPPAMSLMDQVRVARQRQKITQKAIGARFGLTQSQVSAIETGQVDPQLSSVLGFARLLELEPMLIPRALVPAVYALLGSHSEDAPSSMELQTDVEEEASCRVGDDTTAAGGGNGLSPLRKAAP